VAVSDASFRTRYLLLAPAAELAAGNAPGAVRFLADAVGDRRTHLRAEAARRAGRVAALSDALGGLRDVREPRGRQATLEALAAGATPERAETRVLALLAGDRWTFVRIAAARALGSQPRTSPGDQGLMRALEDESTEVRSEVLRALGKRKSHVAAQLIHDVAANPEQHQSVRLAAISALGTMCRKDAAPLLYKLALRAGAAQLPYDQPLGLAALAALGEIKPPDLVRQLAPLLGRDKRVPRLVRLIARDAVTRKGSCGSAKTAAARLPRARSSALRPRDDRGNAVGRRATDAHTLAKSSSSLLAR
jgi:HEAT repeat protein